MNKDMKRFSEIWYRILKIYLVDIVAHKNRARLDGVCRVSNCALWFLKLPHSEAKEQVIYSVNFLRGSSSVLELLETIGNSAVWLWILCWREPHVSLFHVVYHQVLWIDCTVLSVSVNMEICKYKRIEFKYSIIYIYIYSFIFICDICPPSNDSPANLRVQ